MKDAMERPPLSSEQIAEALRIAMETETPKRASVKFSLDTDAIKNEVRLLLPNHSRTAIAEALGKILGKSAPTVRRAINDVFPKIKPARLRNRQSAEQSPSGKGHQDGNVTSENTPILPGTGNLAGTPVATSEASSAIARVNNAKSLFAKVVPK